MVSQIKTAWYIFTHCVNTAVIMSSSSSAASEGFDYYKYFELVAVHASTACAASMCMCALHALHMFVHTIRGRKGSKWAQSSFISPGMVGLLMWAVANTVSFAACLTPDVVRLPELAITFVLQLVCTLTLCITLGVFACLRRRGNKPALALGTDDFELPQTTDTVQQIGGKNS
jgi:hypothetical protein